MIFVSAEDQIKIDTIAKITQGKLRRDLAQKILGISESTLRRWIRKFERQGVVFIRHGNKDRRPVNKVADDVKERVLNLIRERYYKFNILHLREKLEEVEGLKINREKLEEVEGLKINRETLRRWCHELGMVKRSKRHHSKPRYYRERRAQRGLMIQMDGSHHVWFGEKKSVLIAAIDDATSDLHHAEFFTSEDTTNCMHVVQRIVEKRGIFQVLYVDRAGIFGGTKRQQFAQMKRACEEIGIHLLYAASPQAKGRVERLFQTLQDRLIAEMHLRGITTFQEANAYLQNEFIPHQWQKKFTLPPENPEDAFIPWNPRSDLHEIFCFKEYRSIQKDHTVSFNGEFYAIKAEDNISIAGHLLEIREYRNGTLQGFYRNRPVVMRPIKKGLQKLPWYADRNRSKSLGN